MIYAVSSVAASERGASRRHDVDVVELGFRLPDMLGAS
jgi:hypothetical protein